MNEKIQELDWLCFWATAIENLKIPPQVHTAPEQLGLDQKDPKVLRIPDGLETVGNDWFQHSEVEKIIVSKSVKVLGEGAFGFCSGLREIAFEPGSRLECI